MARTKILLQVKQIFILKVVATIFVRKISMDLTEIASPVMPNVRDAIPISIIRARNVTFLTFYTKLLVKKPALRYKILLKIRLFIKTMKIIYA